MLDRENEPGRDLPDFPPGIDPEDPQRDRDLPRKDPEPDIPEPNPEIPPDIDPDSPGREGDFPYIPPDLDPSNPQNDPQREPHVDPQPQA